MYVESVDILAGTVVLTYETGAPNSLVALLLHISIPYHRLEA